MLYVVFCAISWKRPHIQECSLFLKVILFTELYKRLSLTCVETLKYTGGRPNVRRLTQYLPTTPFINLLTDPVSAYVDRNIQTISTTVLSRTVTHRRLLVVFQRDALYLIAVITSRQFCPSIRLSVRLSVCLSVTFMICVKKAEQIELDFGT